MAILICNAWILNILSMMDSAQQYQWQYVQPKVITQLGLQY